jgi:hypothetical protein
VAVDDDAHLEAAFLWGILRTFSASLPPPPSVLVAAALLLLSFPQGGFVSFWRRGINPIWCSFRVVSLFAPF